MTARDEAIEAAAEGIFEIEYPRYSPAAHEDSNRWSWRGDGHGEEFKATYRVEAAAALAASLPLLLNDLADRIERDAKWVDDAAKALRHAAEGWGS